MRVIEHVARTLAVRVAERYGVKPGFRLAGYATDEGGEDGAWVMCFTLAPDVSFMDLFNMDDQDRTFRVPFDPMDDVDRLTAEIAGQLNMGEA